MAVYRAFSTDNNCVWWSRRRCARTKQRTQSSPSACATLRPIEQIQKKNICAAQFEMRFYTRPASMLVGRSGDGFCGRYCLSAFSPNREPLNRRNGDPMSMIYGMWWAPSLAQPFYCVHNSETKSDFSARLGRTQSTHSGYRQWISCAFNRLNGITLCLHLENGRPPHLCAHKTSSQ